MAKGGMKKTGKQPTKSRISKFLEDNRHRKFRGGHGCLTCSHVHCAEMEADCKEYFAAIKDGESAMPWTRFVDEAIREHYGFTMQSEALMRHLRRCRKWDV